jgi:hypothetical protein
MHIREIKIWLVAATVPLFCYFCQAAQTGSETYHRDLVAYLQDNDSQGVMTELARRLGTPGDGEDQLRRMKLTFYYLLHPGKL